ncbi:MAG: TQO small subunit DoxD [Sporomusaceae bacterium]|nr:TQO small subunit DoxD [Sporomusaceae bacterium]
MDKIEKNFASVTMNLLLLPIRFVAAWMFFSAAWRRLVLDGAKMDPNNAAWIGGKINTFYPHALGIKPLLYYLLTNPDLLNIFMWFFTFIEFTVGFCVAFGLVSRLAALGVTVLSFSMLLGAGWLGATCLDEWQIGSFGIAIGVILFMSGSGNFSLDAVIGRRWPSWIKQPMSWITSGNFVSEGTGRKLIYGLTAFTVIAMLWTNQAFVGGLWGPLSNPSAKPHVQIDQISAKGTQVTIKVFRDGGPDTYGAFVTELVAEDANGTVLADLRGEHLSAVMKKATIQNSFPLKVKAGPDGIIIPLGAEAIVNLDLGKDVSNVTKITLRDVSGVKWVSK